MGVRSVHPRLRQLVANFAAAVVLVAAISCWTLLKLRSLN
jgi:hypothetical protein